MVDVLSTSRFNAVVTDLVSVTVAFWTLPLDSLFTSITEFAPILYWIFLEDHLVSIFARHHFLEWITMAREAVLFTALRTEVHQPISLGSLDITLFVAD